VTGNSSPDDGGSPRGSASSDPSDALSPAAEQERLIAQHEAAHGPLPRRILGELRSGARWSGAAGSKAAGALGSAAEALHLEIVATGLPGPRALVGHVLGMRLLIPAEGVHGPRETAALLYLFRDALAIRPTDDAPMSAVPLFGLHAIIPQVAIARWVYKAGRTAHANMDLVKQEKDFEASLGDWTVDDFREADPKLEVFELGSLPSATHLYQNLGLVRLTVPLPGGHPVRLKSAIPESSSAFVRMWELFGKVDWPAGLTMERPSGPPEETAGTGGSQDASGDDPSAHPATGSP
jgi:hypothetical protein